jgi:hypothetical protein
MIGGELLFVSIIGGKQRVIGQHTHKGGNTVASVGNGGKPFESFGFIEIPCLAIFLKLQEHINTVKIIILKYSIFIIRSTFY